MHANVVVKRIPYVMAPSPLSRTSLFLSVTSCRKLRKSFSHHDNAPHLAEPVFVVGEERVWHPDFLGEVAREGEDLLLVAEG